MKFKERVKKTWKWLKVNALNKQMIVYVLIAEVIFWSPCIISGVLAVTISPWWWTVFSAICVFWAGPITPAVPLQIGLAILIKKIVERKKKMKVNTNLELRERSRVTLSGFRGLNTLSTAVDVSAIHATEMENLISRDGVNHKRYGWKTQLRIRDYDSQNNGFFPKIQGIFEFTIHSKRFVIVYANRKFWMLNLDKGTYSNINNKSIAYGETLDIKDKEEPLIALLDEKVLKDRQCKCFQNGDKVYFIGCGDYLVFSRWENDRFELRRVVGNEDVYIPTTTENIGYHGMSNPPTRITAEEKNILSPYTKNLLIGPESLEKDSHVTYYLDNTSFNNLEVSINRYNGEIVELKRADEGYYIAGEELNEIYIPETTLYRKQEIRGQSLEINLENSHRVATMQKGALEIIMEWGDMAYIPVQNFNPVLKGPATVTAILYYRSNTDGVIEELAMIDCDIEYDCKMDGQTLTANIMIKFKKFKRGTQDLPDKTLADSYRPGEFKLINRDSYQLVGKDVVATVNPKQGKLLFKGVEGKEDYYAPLVPGKPNITVKMEYIQSNNVAFDSILACKFGTQGENDRLFFVDETGNTIRWSESQNFTYFGEKAWCVCGTPDKKITGMECLNDSTLLVVKEYSVSEPSVYVIAGNIVTSKTEANTIDYYALFAPKGYQVGVGAIGELINFNGECLMTAKDGFYAVSLGENMTVDSKYVIQRSKQINNILEKFQLDKARCISYNGKFYAFVGGDKKECFVADSKYLLQYDGTTQYEWWRWTNIPVSVWGFLNNELWFGTDDGQICCFTKKFYDEPKTKLEEGLICYNATDNEITDFNINEDIKVEDGELIIFDCDMWGKVEVGYEVVNGKTIYNLPLKDYEKDTHFYYVVDEEVIQKEIIKTETGIEVDGSWGGAFYRNYKGIPLSVKIEDGKIHIQKDGKKLKWLKSKCTSSTDLLATLKEEKNIIARWKSGAMDLGTRVYSKTITGFSLTGERDFANRLKYKITHRLGKGDYEHFRANNDLDFEGTDLQTISLDTNFASTYLKKLNIRNVNFIMLEFEQDTREDMAINSVQLEFKLCKKNIGVR